MKIGLLRHAKTEWNAIGRLQGQADTALTTDARAELASFTLPPEWREARLISSPLGRARDTAQILTGTAPETDDRLMEMHLGAWQGQRGIDLLADPNSGYEDIHHWGWDYQPPGGETPRQLWQRVAASLESLAEDGRDTLIVCHMIVMRVTLARAHGWDFDGPAPFTVKRNRIYPLRWEAGQVEMLGEPLRLIKR